MLRKLGKSLRRLSSESRMDFRLLLAKTNVSREGNMMPNLRTSLQSCRLLSVMCSSRRVGHGVADTITVLYSLRHRNSSSNLEDTHGCRWGLNCLLKTLINYLHEQYSHHKRMENGSMFAVKGPWHSTANHSFPILSENVHIQTQYDAKT